MVRYSKIYIITVSPGCYMHCCSRGRGYSHRQIHSILRRLTPWRPEPYMVLSTERRIMDYAIMAPSLPLSLFPSPLSPSSKRETVTY